MSDYQRPAHGGPLRFALIGVGRISASHLGALGEVGGAQLTAVVEPREETGRAVADKEGVPWFPSHDDPALLTLIDAAIITAPPSLHHPIAGYFLRHDKHVLCEKPFTLDAGQAQELVELAKSRGLLAMLASKFRYVDDVTRARELIADGTLGDIALVENTFLGRVEMGDRWNAQRALSGGGVLIDNGSHSIDITRYLLGPLESVQAQVGPSIQGLEVEDTARILLKTRAGATAIATLSWSVNGEAPYIQVFGSEGQLVLGWKEGRYKVNGAAEWVRFGSGYDKSAAFRGQLANFVETVAGRQAPRITAEDGLEAVRAVEAAYASASEGRWIPLQDGL